MCEIFTLTLGPFRFEVLGMVIDVDAVVFRFGGDALSEPVGRWLCALAEAPWLDVQASALSLLPRLSF